MTNGQTNSESGKPQTVAPTTPGVQKPPLHRLAAAALGIAAATGVGYGLLNTNKPAVEQVTEVPDTNLTPGVIDPAVTAPDICAKDWAPGGDDGPPQKGGDQTYSKAARHTSEAVKNAVFKEYDLENPHDGGHTYEIDHLVPLSLGGRDVKENLWPQSRLTPGWNAFVKDRLEFRLYNIICHPEPGDPKISLKQAQDALRYNWVNSYQTYCADEDSCPNFSESGGS